MHACWNFRVGICPMDGCEVEKVLCNGIGVRFLGLNQSLCMTSASIIIDDRW
jgi:hypothetical protein